MTEARPEVNAPIERSDSGLRSAPVSDEEAGLARDPDAGWSSDAPEPKEDTPVPGSAQRSEALIPADDGVVPGFESGDHGSDDFADELDQSIDLDGRLDGRLDGGLDGGLDFDRAVMTPLADLPPSGLTPAPAAEVVPAPAARAAPRTDDVAALLAIALSSLRSAARPGDGAPEHVARAWTLLDVLSDELDAELAPARQALLLHAVGAVAEDVLDAPELAVRAYAAADAADPGFAVNGWALRALLARVEGPAAVHAQLAQARGVVGAVHRRGHLALAAGAGRAAAVRDWATADSDRDGSGPALAAAIARYPHHVAAGELKEAAAALDAAAELSESPVLSGVLLLERVHVLQSQSAPPRESVGRFREAMEHLGPSPAVTAALEPFAVRTGSLDLWLDLLRNRLEAVTASMHRDSVDGDAGLDDEIGEVFSKTAWVLERQGRHEEALREYDNALNALPEDRCLLFRASELSRRLGRYDDQRRYLERVAARSTDPVECANVLFHIGILAQEVLGDDEGAVDAFSRAADVLPRFTPALAALGRQAIRKGNWTDIRNRFESEIDRLETALAQSESVEIRGNLVRALASRHYRVARLLESEGAGIEAALEYDRRAHLLAPDFLPPRLALERIFETTERWPALVEHHIRLGERAEAAGQDPIPDLLRGADVMRVYVGDDEAAGRIYARVLGREPAHAYALQMAGEVFARAGQRTAQVEVDRRYAIARPGDLVARARLVRAAEAQELDGDRRMAAAEALPLFRDAIEALPGDSMAFDGILRASMRLGRSAGLGQRVVDWLGDGVALPWVTLVQVAELLVAGGHLNHAERVLNRCFTRIPTHLRNRRVYESALVSLRALIHERAGAWGPLAHALEQKWTTSVTDEERGVWLARQGELWEFRLGDTRRAEDAYERAVDFEPNMRAGHLGLERLRAPKPALDAPAPEMTPALDEGDRAVRDAFEEEPSRRERFDAWMARLRGPDRARERIDALWKRLPYEDEEGRHACLASLTGLSEAIGDDDAVRRAAEQWRSAEPRALPPMLALLRLAERSGDESERLARLERLAEIARAPRRAAAYAYEAAMGQQRSGASASVVRQLLQLAIDRFPNHIDAASALESALRRERDWPALMAFLTRRTRVVTDSTLLKALYRERVRLYSGPLDNPEAALACLEESLDRFPDDAGTAFETAAMANRLGNTARALRHLDRLAEDDDPTVRTRAGVSRAAILRGVEDRPGCVEVLRDLIVGVDDDADLREQCERLVDAFADQRDWKSALGFFHRLNEMVNDKESLSARGRYIADVVAQMAGGSRPTAEPTASGIVDPFEAPAADPQVQIDRDELDAAISGVRAHLHADPFDAAALEVIEDLYGRVGEWYGRAAARAARVALDYADEATVRAHEAVFADFRVTITEPITQDLYRAFLLDDGELSLTGELFRRFAPMLTEAFRRAPPAGASQVVVPDVDAARGWHVAFKRITRSLNLDQVALLVTPSEALSAMYLPGPAVIAGIENFTRTGDATTAFTTGRLLESLRDGRALLWGEDGPASIAAGLAEICGELSPKLAAVYPRDVGPSLPLARLAPLRLALSNVSDQEVRDLEWIVDGVELTGLDAVETHAAAVEATCDRAGLIVCGDLAAALDFVVFDGRRFDGSRADAVRHNARGVALLRYGLDPAGFELRRLLGAPERGEA